jgi:uncharacterized membrane protein
MPRLPRHEVTVFLALALCSVAGGALLVCRLIVTGATSFGFLPWNLLLAWVPFGAAATLRLLDHQDRLTRPRAALLVAMSFGFFPNAPYLVTDFVHLRPRPGEAPLWFDIGVLMIFAWTGLLLGFVSLDWVQQVLRARIGSVRSALIAIVVLGLSGYGIYLGRFARFNSWDLLLRPIDIARHLADVIVHPRSHPRTLAVTLLYGALLGGAYFTLLAFASQTREEPRCPRQTI